jgi:hypothetical protein
VTLRWRTLRVRFAWRGWPEVCDECHARDILGWLWAWIWPSLWNDPESGLSCVWYWSLWWGPLHVWSEVPEAERVARFAEYNARARARWAE